MSETEFAAALERALTAAVVDAIARDRWLAYGAGELGEAEAERLVADRGGAPGGSGRRMRPGGERPPSPSRPSASSPPGSVVACRPIARPRGRAGAGSPTSGPLPPALAAGLRPASSPPCTSWRTRRGRTDLQAAAGRNRVAGGRMRHHSAQCDPARGRRRAFHHRRTAPARRPSLPNVIRIISREWRAWIARGGRGEGPNCRTPRINKDLLSWRQPPNPRRAA